MYCFKKITLSNFRCYKSASFDFKKGINIIYGNNGIGKTTVVEAISYLLIGKSFRNVRDIDVLRTNEAYFSSVGEIGCDKYVVYYDLKGKKISKNQKQYSKISDFVGENCLVSFSPDDLRIVNDGPIEKRKFLDISLCQLDKEYLNNLSLYNKMLKERNHLLKEFDRDSKNQAVLDIIDEKIIEYGKTIIVKREKFIANIKNSVERYMELLTDGKDKVKIQYIPKVYVNTYEKELKKRRDHDLMLETTTVGPHRDDINVLINEKDAESCASQGQKRSLTLALKLGFYEMLVKNNKKTFVILDDVFSELDLKRQNNLLKLLKNETQVFITCTNIDLLSNEIINNSNIINIGKD